MSERIGHRPKGLPKTGGRRPGSRNKVTIEREHAVETAYAGLAAALGADADKLKAISPIEAMLLCLQWSLAARDRVGVLAAASAVAPYLHAKQATAVALNVSGTVTLSDDDLARQVAELEGKMAAARLLN